MASKQATLAVHALRRHQLLTYFVLAYAFTWLFWIPLAIFFRGHTTNFGPNAIWVGIGNIWPSVVGVALTGFFAGGAGLRELLGRVVKVRAPIAWYAVTLLLFPTIQLVATGLPGLVGLARVAYSGMSLANVGGVLLFAALGEELGWRGFALPRMQARRQAFATSLILGLIWSFWHLPLRIAFGDSMLNFLWFVIGGPLPVSILMVWIYNNTRGSLFLMVLFHVMNDVPILAVSTVASAVISLILIWAIVLAVVVIYGPARLSRSSAPTQTELTPAIP